MERGAHPRGHADYVLLAGELVIITGWLELPEEVPARARLFAGEEELELHEQEILRTTRDDVSEHLGTRASRWGFVLFAELGDEPSSTALSLVMESARGSARLAVPSPEAANLREFLAEIQTARPEERDEIRAAVERRIGKLAPRGDALPRPDELDPPIPASVDRACLVPGKGVFLYGWILDLREELRAVHLVTPGQLSANLLTHGARHRRDDIEEAFPESVGAPVPPGLIAFVPADLDDGLAVGELLFVTHSGEAAMLSFTIEDPPGGIFQQVELMIATLRPDDVDVADLLDAHIGPAIEARWEARRPVAHEVREHQFGTSPTSPRCSIVVPLYGRYDFLMYQLSAFARDPELAEMDLIYVIDDERIREATLRLAREISPLWPTPFRILDLGGNLGYAGANNAGARVATGDLLLLLNSDVMPDSPGWVGRLCAKHRSLTSCGALAPRLLFEDGSIQHDGIEFKRHPRIPSIWLNDHPGKGLPPSFLTSGEDGEAPAVTGACLLVRRDTYLDLGGLDEGYILGDFEDSDLCLRMRERGLKSYVVRGESLFHLERQSQNHLERPDWRAKITLYNAWRHTRRWGSVLESLGHDS